MHFSYEKLLKVRIISLLFDKTLNSFMKLKKHLSLAPLVNGFKKAFHDYQEIRQETSTTYSTLDTALSGLACMFYQSGNMVNYQERMEQKHHRNNLQTQFGVVHTPKDNQMRKIIGSIPSAQFAPVFDDYLAKLQRSKYLASYQFQKKYLVAIDATEYYSSEAIHCSCCLTQTKRNGVVQYSHKALQPIICHPDKKLILPLMPEEIKNTDGTEKQDCEINAAYRLLPSIRSRHPRMSFIWLADSLYATAPFIQNILDAGEDYLFRVKQGDHKKLFETIETAPYESLKSCTENSKTTIAHRWYKDIPLNGSSDITVTVIRAFAISTDKNGNQTSTILGVWATNLDVNEPTVISITKAARARWKVENECFNTLKNHGYDLTHNWGHVNGESFNFYILIMLAFYIHQILEMTDKLFQWCRSITRTFRKLWVELGVLFEMFLFESWEHMLCFYAEKKEKPPPFSM